MHLSLPIMYVEGQHTTMISHDPELDSDTQQLVEWLESLAAAVKFGGKARPTELLQARV